MDRRVQSSQLNYPMGVDLVLVDEEGVLVAWPRSITLIYFSIFPFPSFPDNMRGCLPAQLVRATR